MPLTPLPFVPLTERSVAGSPHKRNELGPQVLPLNTRAQAALTPQPPLLPSAFPLFSPSAMAASSVYAAQVSAGRYPHGHDHSSTSPPLTPLSATLVNAARHIQRPSIELKFSSSGSKIVNSVVADATGQPLYSIWSDSRRTKLLSHRDNNEVATVEWNRSSPRMVFRGKKIKCKDWLPLAGPETEYVLMILPSYYDCHSDLGMRRESGLVFSCTVIRSSRG